MVTSDDTIVHFGLAVCENCCARCGHCKNLEPDFEKVASQLAEDRAMGETSVVVAKVDATQEKYLQGAVRLRSATLRIACAVFRP
jgi:hypothetical protein